MKLGLIDLRKAGLYLAPGFVKLDIMSLATNESPFLSNCKLRLTPDLKTRSSSGRRDDALAGAEQDVLFGVLDDTHDLHG